MYRKSKHILVSVIFVSDSHAVCEKMWENFVQSEEATDNNTIWRMRCACWATEASNIHS